MTPLALQVLEQARASGGRYYLPLQSFGSDKVDARSACQELVNQGLATWNAVGMPKGILLIADDE